MHGEKKSHQYMGGARWPGNVHEPIIIHAWLLFSFYVVTEMVTSSTTVSQDSPDGSAGILLLCISC